MAKGDLRKETKSPLPAAPAQARRQSYESTGDHAAREGTFIFWENIDDCHRP